MPNTVRIKGDGKSRVAVKAQYVRLLSAFVPVAIETDAENERALKMVDALMRKTDRTEAESGMLKLLAVLIGNFEQRSYWMGDASPLETLKELMNAIIFESLSKPHMNRRAEKLFR